MKIIRDFIKKRRSARFEKSKIKLKESELKIESDKKYLEKLKKEWNKEKRMIKLRRINI